MPSHKYKHGDVAALFSKPKEPTTPAGKKLQSLFQEFHSGKRKPTFQSQDEAPRQNKEIEKENGDNENQGSNKKNKKRKFSATMESDQTSKYNEKKNKDNNIPGSMDFPRKKKKKLNSFDSSNLVETEVKDENKFESEANSKSWKSPKTKKMNFKEERVENEFDSATNSKFNNSPKTKKFKSKVKKSVDNKFESVSNLKLEASPKTKTSKFENKFDQGSNSKFNNNVKAKKTVSGFIKMSKQQKFKNKNVNTGHTEKNEIEDQDGSEDSDESFKDEIKEFIKKNSKQSKEMKNRKIKIEQVSPKKSFDQQSDFIKTPDIESDAEVNDSPVSKKSLSNDKEDSQMDCNSTNNPRSQNQDFIRKPRNKNQSSSFRKDDNEKFNKSPSKKLSDNNDILFKTENEENVKHDNKNFKRKFKDVNNSVQNSHKNLSEPDFIKLSKSEPDKDEALKRTIFVGNLPVNASKKALRILFSPFGEIENIRYFGVETDKSKIFSGNHLSKSPHGNYASDSVPGFIVFKEQQSAIDALSLSGTIFKDRHITVDISLPPGTKKYYDDKRSIFIGNLPFDIKDESIWNAFSNCGRIEGVRAVRDRATGIGKGFGYVIFSTVQAKENALALENLEIEGRLIRIKAVESDKEKQKPKKITVTKNTFKSRAIQIKKKNKSPNSRKSITKIMKKEKNKFQKKKIASLLLKSMK